MENNWAALGKAVEQCQVDLEGANANHGNDEWEILDDKQKANNKSKCPAETATQNQPAQTKHNHEPEKPSAPPKPQFKTVLEVLQKSLEKSLRDISEEREMRKQFYKGQTDEELAAQRAAVLQQAVDRYRWLASDIHAQPNELRDLYKKIVSSVTTSPPYPSGLYCSLCWLGDGYL